MRAIFGVLGLLVVVAIIGLLAKKQLGAGVAPSTARSSDVPAVAAPAGTPQQQVQQFQRAAQEAMQQQPRAMPDDSK